MAPKRVHRFDWKPFSQKQIALLGWWMPNSKFRDYDGVIAEGSIRSGKTITMIAGFLLWAMKTFQNQNFIMSGKTQGSLNKNVLEPMRQILRSWGVEFHENRSEHYITIGTNTFYCYGAPNESSQDVLQGLTSAGWFGDEAALQHETFVTQAIGRCSVPGSKYWLNCNPASPYHLLKTDYIDKAEDKRMLVLHFTMDDNLTLTPAIRKRYERMFSGVFHKRYILGLWVMAEGAIYDMFDTTRHVKKQEASPDKKTYAHYGVACDYGTNNPMVFGLFAWDDPKKVRVLKTYYYDSNKSGRQKTDKEYANDYFDFIRGYPVGPLVIDPSAASFIAELRSRGIFTITKAKNEVLPGIKCVQKYLMDDMLEIDPSCVDGIKEMQSYVWDEKKQKLGLDEPKKENDHFCDMVRYFLYTVFGSTMPGIASFKY